LEGEWEGQRKTPSRGHIPGGFIVIMVQHDLRDHPKISAYSVQGLKVSFGSDRSGKAKGGRRRRRSKWLRRPKLNHSLPRKDLDSDRSLGHPPVFKLGVLMRSARTGPFCRKHWTRHNVVQVHWARGVWGRISLLFHEGLQGGRGHTGCV